MKLRLLYIFVALCALCIPNVNAQNIDTYAGTGAAGFSGDGGPATAAKINGPYAVTADLTGNVYFGDHGNFRLRKINSSGIISTIAGNGSSGYTGDGGPSVSAKVGYIKGICLDVAGNIYFTDDYSVVRKIDITSGVITTVAGIGTSAGGFTTDGIQATASKLYNPIGITFDNSGNLLIADQLNSRIRKVTMSTGIITTICGNGSVGGTGDGGPATAALVNYPAGVAVSLTGNIYIADFGNNRIRKINTAGNISSITYPVATGSYGYSGDGGPSTAAHIYYPYGVATDTGGNIYISDQNNNTIRKINPFGIISSYVGYGFLAGTGTGAFGGDGGLATGAQMNQPSSCVAVPSLGKIYVADRDNNRIRVVSTLHKPYFTNGHSQTYTVCQGVANVGLDTMLAIDDIDVGQTEIWDLVTAAGHGALVVGYAGSSTGGTVLPSGLFYAPFSSYFGVDSFKVRIWDGTAYDTTTIHINILPTYPFAITGRDSLCPGDTTTLMNVVPGGTWGSLNSTLATIGSTTGFVSALTPGMDTITYTYTNPCGAVTSYFPLLVGTYIFCRTGVFTITAQEQILTVAPNPSYNVFTLMLSSPQQEDAHIVITNMMGVKVKEFHVTTNKSTEVLQDYAAGIYFITATTTDGKLATKMITKL